ncbi:MAG: hypothetical protein LIP12_05180 [Clostridiales bacterium]|nr:hypothetical protein [Clostridiales bacterium]
MKPDWTGRIQLVMIIAAVVIAAAVILYGDEIAAWLSKEFMTETHSQLEQLLR